MVLRLTKKTSPLYIITKPDVRLAERLLRLRCRASLRFFFAQNRESSQGKEEAKRALRASSAFTLTFSLYKLLARKFLGDSLPPILPFASLVLTLVFFIGFWV